MIHQATSLLLRDHLLRVADKISGDGWRPLLDALNAHAIQANGAGQLLDQHPRRSSRRSTRGGRAWRRRPCTRPRPGPGRPRAA